MTYRAAWSVLVTTVLAQSAFTWSGGSIRLDALDGTGIYYQDGAEGAFQLNGFYYSAGAVATGSSAYGRLSALTWLNFSPGYLRGQQQVVSGEAHAGANMGDYGTFVSDTLPLGTPIRVVASIKLGGEVLTTLAEWVSSFSRAEARLVTYSTETGIQVCAVSRTGNAGSSTRGKPIIVNTFVGHGMSLQYDLNALSTHRVSPELRYSSASRSNVFASVSVTPPAGVRFEAVSGHNYPQNQLLFR